MRMYACRVDVEMQHPLPIHFISRVFRGRVVPSRYSHLLYDWWYVSEAGQRLGTKIGIFKSFFRSDEEKSGRSSTAGGILVKW